MSRRKKSGIDYWLENCYRCSNMIRSRYLENGIDNGSVSYKCIITGEYVYPWKIDGCKKFDVGIPEEVIINRSLEKHNVDKVEQ